MSSLDYDKVIDQQLEQLEYYIEAIRKQQARVAGRVVYDEERVAAAQALRATAEALAAHVKTHYPKGW